MIRRRHKKSKNGCAGCKRRHMKCDESHPRCVNCMTAKLECSFVAGHNSTDQQSPSPSTAGSPEVVLPPGPPVNFMHLELYHYLVYNDSTISLLSQDVPDVTRMKVLGHAFAAPSLMYQLLAISALRLSVLRPEKQQLYREESVKLQTEALRLFNESFESVDERNIVPAFLFSSVFGIHFFYDAFSMVFHSLNDFLDQLVQSIKLFQGVRTIIGERWETILQSDISGILGEYDSTEQIDDEIMQQFEKARLEICRSPGLDEAEAKVCETAMEQLSSEYSSRRKAQLKKGGRNTAGMATSWLIILPAGYPDLLAHRKPEALIVLAYFSVLLHLCRDFWAVKDAGRILLDALGEFLGDDWAPWLIWPRSIISH